MKCSKEQITIVATNRNLIFKRKYIYVKEKGNLKEIGSNVIINYLRIITNS